MSPSTVHAARRSLLLASGVCFGIALLHVAIIFAGPEAYVYFGAPDLGIAERRGSLTPDRITWVLVVLFSGCGYYALAGAGHARWRPPLLALGLVVVGGVFTMRGLALAPEVLALSGVDFMKPVPPRYAIFSLVSLVTGLATLLGTWRAWPSLHHHRTGT